MLKPFLRSFAVLFALSTVAHAAFASVTGSGVFTPPNYDTFVPPGSGATFTDAAFGTSVKRLSESMKMTDNAGSGGLTTVGTEYSTASPFNSNNSYLILQHNSYYGLYDGNGGYLRDLPFAVNASTEPRWSRSDPNALFYVTGNKLMKLDVASGGSTLLHAFSEYGAVSGMGESDISRDGDHFVFAGDKREIFVYQVSSGAKGQVLDTSGHAFNNLYIAPDNSVAIGWLANGSGRWNGVELFDRNMSFKRQLTHAIGHMHLTRDTNGDDVLVWTNSADAQPLGGCQNGIVKVRLSDAHQTCLLELDWSLAVHITAADGNGWAVVETYAPSNPFPATDWAPYTNEILQVPLGGGEPQRLVHHRSRPFDSYVYQPKATVSRDGTKLAYTSNTNLQAIFGYPNVYTDAYLVNLGGPSNTPPPAQTTPPVPAPLPNSVPAPAPAPVPAPSASAGARVEQDSSSVVFSGSWSPNQIASHSGGSAKLAMDPGSRATFTFAGTGASWIGYRDGWSGIATVIVDGVVKGTLDTYSPTDLPQATLYTVNGLRNGTHTLTIEATGNHGPVSAGSWIWVDAFAVTK